VISLPEGSWGEGGFHWIWLNEWTEWAWKKIYEAEDRMVELAQRYRDRTELPLIRVLDQLARELLLLEGSDWPFLISTLSASDYAELRISEHVEAFRRLADLAEKVSEQAGFEEKEEEMLSLSEKQDRIFPDIDFRWWAAVDFPAQGA